MNYHTFDISITPSGTPNHYQIFARSTSQGEAKGTTTIDLESAPLAGLLEQLNDQSISEKGLKSLGTTLYHSLFVGKINMLFNRSLGETLARADIGLRLRLNIEVPELDILPWELLYSPDQILFLAASLETPLCRYLSMPTPIREITSPGQLRILAVIPKSSGLNTAPEKKVLREVERKLGSKIKVDFLKGPATPQAIRDALRDCDYHILHYAGHGLFKLDQAFMILDHDKRTSERLTADQFAHYFLDYHSIRLVVLNACYGATRSAHQALVGIAPQLVRQGVPAVIAMQDTIRDDDAVLFATEFYSELCHQRHGGQVEMAVSHSRKALIQSPSQINAFALPVLYLRAQDGKLWDIEQPEKDVAFEEEPIPKPSPKAGFLKRFALALHIISQKIPQPEFDPGKRSAIKGLRPFDADDAEIFSQLQREQSIRECFESITASNFRFGVLCGESGCGKSSFLQAGLIPQLKQQFQCIYVKFTDLDPLESIRQALIDQVQIPKALAETADFLTLLETIATENSKTLVLFFDQFEQFFVHHKLKEQREPFVQALAAWYQDKQRLPVKIFVCMRGDFSDRLIELQKAMGYSLGPQDSIRLEKLTPQEAAEIFHVIAETEGIACDADFVKELAKQELAREDGLISPVDIQILAWMIRGQKTAEERAFNRHAFQQLGGIEGLLERFLSRVLEVRETEERRQTAIKVLLALTDLERNVRAGVLTAENLQKKLTGSVSDSEISETVQWLARGDIRLITPSKREEKPGYELAHERLIPALRKIAGKELSEADQANQLLNRRANEWLGADRDHHYLLRWRELRQINKQKSFLVWGEMEKTKKELINQSRRRQRKQSVAIGGILILLLIFLIARPSINAKLSERARNQRFEELVQKFVPVEGDTFKMGDLRGEGGEDERPVHDVILSDFKICKHEITNQQYCDFLNSVDTSEFKVIEWIDTTSPYCEIKRRGDRFVVLDDSKRNHPVVTISWYGAVAFCNYLSEHFGDSLCYKLSNWSYDSTANGYRLPTEAEWEFAARGGKKSKGFKYSGSDSLDLVAWYYKNSGNGPSQVGEKQVNELELCDMSGNVYEWCHDWYGGNYYEACQLRGTVKDPFGPSSGGVRVLRGGSWNNDEVNLRCSNRYYNYPNNRYGDIGFRVVR